MSRSATTQLLAVVLALIVVNAAHAVEIKLPVTSKNAQRDAYKIGLLELVLEKAGAKYSIATSTRNYSQSRIIAALKQGSDDINLYWVGTSAKLERDLLAIRFPIYRGLLGHRVFIIHRDDQARFDEVETLADLQAYRGIQGLGWSDIEILENSGLRQHTNTYENIFKMVNRRGRVDYFSRGVSEAFGEVEARVEILPNLAVEKHVLLVYPFAMYFFTSPTNKKLASILEEGFRKVYEDGSFSNYFYNHPDIKTIFREAGIDERVRIEIPNPLLTPETISIPDKYWHGR